MDGWMDRAGPEWVYIWFERVCVRLTCLPFQSMHCVGSAGLVRAVCLYLCLCLYLSALLSNL